MHFRWVFTGLLSFAASTFILGQQPDSIGHSPEAIHQTLSNEDSPPPQWAISFGHEFWREPGRPAAKASGQGTNAMHSHYTPTITDAIDRVSHAFERTSEGARVIAPNYSVAVDRRGFTFASDSGNLKTSEAQSTIFFHVTIQGAASRNLKPSEDILEWFVKGNTAQTLLPRAIGMIQHVEARATGAYLTWVLPHRPRETNGLEINVQMNGMTHAASTETGEHFVGSNGLARIRFGKVTAVDAAGSKWNLATLPARGGLAIKIPAGILAHASYPLAIDPEISPEQGIDIQEYVSDEAFNPSIASNGTIFARGVGKSHK